MPRTAAPGVCFGEPSLELTIELRYVSQGMLDKISPPATLQYYEVLCRREEAQAHLGHEPGLIVGEGSAVPVDHGQSTLRANWSIYSFIVVAGDNRGKAHRTSVLWLRIGFTGGSGKMRSPAVQSEQTQLIQYSIWAARRVRIPGHLHGYRSTDRYYRGGAGRRF